MTEIDIFYRFPTDSWGLSLVRRTSPPPQWTFATLSCCKTTLVGSRRSRRHIYQTESFKISIFDINLLSKFFTMPRKLCLEVFEFIMRIYSSYTVIELQYLLKYISRYFWCKAKRNFPLTTNSENVKIQKLRYLDDPSFWIPTVGL